MDLCIGTKEILARPMTLGEYNAYRGWEMPGDQDPGQEGYLVEYLDGGDPNHENHAGYISWSPKDVFDRAYKPVDNMSFAHAQFYLFAGAKLTRRGWNGKDMFIYLVPGSNFEVNRPPLLGICEEGTSVDYRSHIDMKTAQGDFVPWVASQTDLLANDWHVVR